MSRLHPVITVCLASLIDLVFIVGSCVLYVLAMARFAEVTPIALALMPLVVWAAGYVSVKLSDFLFVPASEAAPKLETEIAAVLVSAASCHQR